MAWVALFELDAWIFPPAGVRVLAVLSALCNVLQHNLFFWLAGIRADPFGGLLPMFAGDLAGIVVVLYAARLVLRLVDRRRLRSTT